MEIVPKATAEPDWRKSSYSAGNGGECVEVAHTSHEMFIRDSKITDGPHLSVPHSAWATLLRACSLA